MGLGCRGGRGVKVGEGTRAAAAVQSRAEPWLSHPYSGPSLAAGPEVFAAPPGCRRGGGRGRNEGRVLHLWPMRTPATFFFVPERHPSNLRFQAPRVLGRP